MKKHGASEKEMWRKNVKWEVQLSPFIVTDKNGELEFYRDSPCPRCDFWMGGEYAGSFKCAACGYDEVPAYSDAHGYSLLLEGAWKLLRPFLPFKRLKWETSLVIYSIYTKLMDSYRRARHQITITDGDYMWDWKKKEWFKFM